MLLLLLITHSPAATSPGQVVGSAAWTGKPAVGFSGLEWTEAERLMEWSGTRCRLCKKRESYHHRLCLISWSNTAAHAEYKTIDKQFLGSKSTFCCGLVFSATFCDAEYERVAPGFKSRQLLTFQQRLSTFPRLADTWVSHFLHNDNFAFLAFYLFIYLFKL